MKSRRKVLLHAGVVGTLGLAIACGMVACTADPAGDLAAEELHWNGSSHTSNLILIVNDTMRRDRLGIYGGPARTPHFDAFAEKNLLFESAYSAAPWTKPAMVTLFTSLYPSQHGVLSHPSVRPGGDRSLDARTDVLSDGFTTLAEVLNRAGFRTAAYVGNPWLRQKFGFAQGFELYDDSLATWNAPGRVVSQKGLGWLEGIGANERFFLYLHYMDTHRPYGRLNPFDIVEGSKLRSNGSRTLNKEVREEIGNLLVLTNGARAVDAGIVPSIPLLEMAYDRGIEDFDRALGLFLDGFNAHPAYERTAIIVVSDHGEALYTRGWGNHGRGLYEDEIAIPLAARLPGVSSRGFRIQSPVGLVDFLPTLCEYLGVAVASDVPVFGRSWLAPRSIKGKLRERYLVVEGVMNYPEHRAILFGEHKALWQPGKPPYDPKERALFRTDRDPGERQDLFRQSDPPESVRETYRDLVRGGIEAVPAFAAPMTEQAPIDPEMLERLRALGYVD